MLENNINKTQTASVQKVVEPESTSIPEYLETEKAISEPQSTEIPKKSIEDNVNERTSFQKDEFQQKSIEFNKTNIDFIERSNSNVLPAKHNDPIKKNTESLQEVNNREDRKEFLDTEKDNLDCTISEQAKQPSNLENNSKHSGANQTSFGEDMDDSDPKNEDELLSNERENQNKDNLEVKKEDSVSTDPEDRVAPAQDTGDASTDSGQTVIEKSVIQDYAEDGNRPNRPNISDNDQENVENTSPDNSATNESNEKNFAESKPSLDIEYATEMSFANQSEESTVESVDTKATDVDNMVQTITSKATEGSIDHEQTKQEATVDENQDLSQTQETDDNGTQERVISGESENNVESSEENQINNFGSNKNVDSQEVEANKRENQNESEDNNAIEDEKSTEIQGSYN